MDHANQYCPIRRNFEERSWNLVSRLSSLVPGLISSAGIDTKVFNATTAQCRETQSEIAEIRHQLQAHRAKHGC